MRRTYNALGTELAFEFQHGSPRDVTDIAMRINRRLSGDALNAWMMALYEEPDLLYSKAAEDFVAKHGMTIFVTFVELQTKVWAEEAERATPSWVDIRVEMLNIDETGGLPTLDQTLAAYRLINERGVK
jgi:hypothetical protein